MLIVDHKILCIVSPDVQDWGRQVEAITVRLLGRAMKPETSHFLHTLRKPRDGAHFALFTAECRVEPMELSTEASCKQRPPFIATGSVVHKLNQAHDGGRCKDKARNTG